MATWCDGIGDGLEIRPGTMAVTRYAEARGDDGGDDGGDEDVDGQMVAMEIGSDDVCAMERAGGGGGGVNNGGWRSARR